MSAPALPPPRLPRLVGAALMLSALAGFPARAADPPPFDLVGPGLRITVTRGAATLPIGQVPNLEAGDMVDIAADLPADQRTRFLLVSAFLNGATNPPPKKWIDVAETWKPKGKHNTLALTVPDGAHQLILFVVPDTGGAGGAISGAVRGKPGEFVRATQSLNQASLDRSRLDTFVAAIHAQENTHPEYLKSIAPTLARSLAIKLNEECLAKVVESQAACLLENRDALVLTDVHGNTIADTLTGAPTDLALQLSYTREAGLGYYSPYIGVIRDLARVFGAFNNPQFTYLPTLSVRQGDGVSLLLNTAPSFVNPKSVLVAAMPSIGKESPPRFREGAAQALCGARPDLVLPVEGAPLVYSTGYAHEMMVRLTSPGGVVVERPVVARADRAGYVSKDAGSLGDFHGTVDARLHGLWGFEPFDGPAFKLEFPDGRGWQTPADTSLVVGRDNALTLSGSAPACIESATMRIGDAAPQPLTWAQAGDMGVTLTLPLKDARAGTVTIELRQYGATEGVTIRLKSYRQASKLDGLDLHDGDNSAILSGQRLDQVTTVDLDHVRFKPDGLTRDGDVDRLKLKAEGDGMAPGAGAATAKVTLTDGRTLNLPLTIAPPRPQVTLLSKTLVPSEQTKARFRAFGESLLPDGARLDFSVRAGDGTRLQPSDTIEIATVDASASTTLTSQKGLRLESPSILVASFDPAVLGNSVAGPLRFRLLRGTDSSDWQPLMTLVRLPRIDSIVCTKGAMASCTLHGDGLNLIEDVRPAEASDRAVSVPRGFTGGTLTVPVPTGATFQVRLYDAPTQSVELCREICAAR